VASHRVVQPPQENDAHRLLEQMRSPQTVGGLLDLALFFAQLQRRKLQSGIQVNKYMISFGTRENEVGVVVKCESLLGFSGGKPLHSDAD
jgi:hypothetical protein